MMVKRKLDGAVDESSEDQEICKSNATSIGIGSQAVRQTKFGLAKVLHWYSNFDAFLTLFSSKHSYKVVLKNVKFCKAI